ncbi:MAG: hypothetical protein COB16_00680 [Rhodobacteraceae bacterium]|nr:MAG: hypothetical protein COB16_00680 [Paracoccaceae bacterium]
MRHLFRLSETNAIGHVATTVWDEACQAPDTVTDINGLATDYSYDTHCREDYVSLPGSNYVDTQYQSLGDATAQYIRKISLSPSTAPGSATQESREYFDGFGEVYRTATTGSTSAEADLITTVRAFDVRGKVMTYDGENRPLTVTALNGDQTEYVYGAVGTRLKRIEMVNGETTTSLYVGGVEIVQAPNEPELVHWYPHSNVRMDYEAGAFKEVKYLHRDQLGSVFLITDATGNKDTRRDFTAFGDELETISDAAMASYPAKEDFGFIGEREDEAAGLMYLNARYYDPELALFILADPEAGRPPKAGQPRGMHPTLHPTLHPPVH